jgi:hypothetical protein
MSVYMCARVCGGGESSACVCMCGIFFCFYVLSVGGWMRKSLRGVIVCVSLIVCDCV